MIVLAEKFWSGQIRFLNDAVSSLPVPRINDVKAAYGSYLDAFLRVVSSSKPVETLELRLPPLWNETPRGLSSSLMQPPAVHTLHNITLNSRPWEEFSLEIASVRQEEEPEPITNLIFLDDEVFSNFGEVIDTTDAS
ncbi:uncharacterized protein ACA1_068000 [Acanthamoeba castellanii str. Neff]|uniref:Uncharacterized protein n=1 Tax=Acanthamoeba castellanii (strain ATCC 30010 / Neff) TaxID=1257118 RepID=L8HFL7_ACACF|nr:uncharacterized protein ACA1_068000 [Acanthamoeba castellanii str. Neff]ELR23216.1 hypothetical protein ACA1_068000 [Acanthamoeba castellanii str. Neff]